MYNVQTMYQNIQYVKRVQIMYVQCTNNVLKYTICQACANNVCTMYKQCIKIYNMSSVCK